MRKVERVQPDGSIRIFTVKRLSDRHSTNVAAKFASKSRGYAKRGAKHKTDIVSPKGLPTGSRMPGDERI